MKNDHTKCVIYSIFYSAQCNKQSQNSISSAMSLEKIRLGKYSLLSQLKVSEKTPISPHNHAAPIAYQIASTSGDTFR